MTKGKANRYERIIEAIFESKYKRGAREVPFEREDIERTSSQLDIALPKNLGDLVYSFRYRAVLPRRVTETAPKGQAWVIRPAGRSKYSFVLLPDRPIAPNPALAQTKVPDSTPGLVARYALSDEQALLAKVRYNRLIDIFTGVACYSLQNHLRTQVRNVGQVETDEIYVGIDKRGVQYVFPVQAKGGRDKLSIVQIEQDVAVCQHKFPRLLCRPIGAQFISEDLIALFEFEQNDGVTISAERHYRLVAPDEISPEDLEVYRRRTDQEL